MSFRNLYERVRDRLDRDISANFSTRPVRVRLPHPIVSFTFDDFPASADKIGGAILEEHGFAGTYYTSLGLADKSGPVGRYFSESDLPGLLRRGHELGCHTYDHCNAWTTPTAEYELSVIRNRQRLGQLLPGAEFVSHSYPIYCPKPRTKTVAAKYFSSARGGGQKFNMGVADANSLAAFFIEKSRDDFPLIKSQLDGAMASGAWLVFATHDVGDKPGPFGCTSDLFAKIVRYTKEAGIAVLPVSRVMAMLHAKVQS